MREAIEQTAAHVALVTKQRREALRVLYVGWTRARDRLVLAAREGQLLAGIIGALDPPVVVDPEVGADRVIWGDVAVAVGVHVCGRVGATVEREREAGSVTAPRVGTSWEPARRVPSETPAVRCEVGEVVVLGPRIALRGRPDMTAIGDAVHAFLAAEAGADDREVLAAALLADHRVEGQVEASSLIEVADRLTRWASERYAGLRWHREWPIYHRLSSGTLVAGSVDLVLEGGDGVVVIDHKAFPGTFDAAMARARGHSGQLAAYAAALARPILATWIHLPIRGELIQIVLKDGDR